MKSFYFGILVIYIQDCITSMELDVIKLTRRKNIESKAGYIFFQFAA